MGNILASLTARFKSTGLILALAVSGMALSSGSARADDFSFWFTNTIGDVSGTVAGEIIGLTNNSTGPAEQVLITSFPSDLNSVFGSGPIDAMLWDQQYENSFTETGGVVTGGGFRAYDTINSLAQGAQLYVNGGPGYNFLNLDGQDNLYVYGNYGFAAAHITPQVSAPEPSALLLLATGLAGVLGAFRRKLAS